MTGASQFGRPYLIERLEDTASAKSLKRLQLGNRKNNGEAYPEKFLQDLIMRHPNLLPIDEIESALTPAIPVCRELPVPSGFVDNLLVTPDGGIILVECKLWRNPQARREVVGQIVDYAKDLSSWTYEDLDGAVGRATGRNADKGGHLFDYVADVPEVDEARFVDGISQNLRRGRFLLLVVGDGIREGVEEIAGFLQGHAGLHFTLSLVELAIFSTPPTGFLVQPRVLAKTVTIERGIVAFEDSKLVFRPPLEPRPSGSSLARGSISEAQFFEELEKSDRRLGVELRKFLDRLGELGVAATFGKGLVLRWQPDEAHRFNLGAIYSNGDVATDHLNWTSDNVGRLDLAHQYLERVATCIQDGIVKQTPNPKGWYVRTTRGNLKLDDLLSVQDCWFLAIRAFTEAMGDVLRGDS